MVEKEKSVAELTAELDAFANIPADFEQVKTAAPKTPVKPPQSSVPIPAPPPIPSQPAPIVEPIAKQEPIIEHIAAQSVRPSFDGMLEKIKAAKFKQIDDEATAKKAQAENGLYEGLAALIELAANGKSITQPIQQPQVILPPVVEQVVVKDNSEAIAAINVQLEDDSVKDKTALLRVKRQLQGQPFASEDERMFNATPLKKPVDPKSIDKSKGVSIKVALATFALVAISTGSVYFILSAIFHVF